MTGPLTGGVAFDAGTGRGIGRTAAPALAEAGAGVAVAARSEREGRPPGIVQRSEALP